MRPALPALVLLLPLLATHAQEESHDELGFPITFDEERITRNDVLRSIGSPQSVGAGTLAAARDTLLMNKVTARMAEMWGIEVQKADVERAIRRDVQLKGGEAKFYESLRERGDTLARYEDEMELQVLRYNLHVMLTTGRAPPPQNKILPWAIRPTPAEVRLAIRNDAERVRNLPRLARAMIISVAVDKKRRKQLQMKAIDDEEFDYEGAILAEAGKLAAGYVARLESGTSFEELARSLGTPIDRQREFPIKLPKEASDDPVLEFLKTAKPGSHSRPIALPGGILKIVYLVERKEAASADELTAQLYDSYVRRIVGLRREKVQAIMRLQAIDRSQLRPEFVLKQFRRGVVADLKAAMTGLNALGLR